MKTDTTIDTNALTARLEFMEQPLLIEANGNESSDEYYHAEVCHRAAEALRTLQLEQHQWHRVATFLVDHDCVWHDNAKYPDDGEWILVESESATGIRYEAFQYDLRSWPGFGVRWKYCSPPEQEVSDG